MSDPDPKLIIPDLDPANNFGSDRIRIHNTGICLYFAYVPSLKGHTVVAQLEAEKNLRLWYQEYFCFLGRKMEIQLEEVENQYASLGRFCTVPRYRYLP